MVPLAPRGLAASSLLWNHPTSLPTSCRCRCLHLALPCFQGLAETSWGKVVNLPGILSSIHVGPLGIPGFVFSGTLAHPTCLTRLHFRSGRQFVIRLPLHTASRLMQLPSTRGCLPKAPQGSFTLWLITMPNAPGARLRSCRFADRLPLSAANNRPKRDVNNLPKESCDAAKQPISYPISG